MNRIGIVLDKSGSMESIRTDTLGGFNAWLKTLKETGQDAKVTLTLFDTNFVQLWDGKPLKECQPLKADQYAPGGNTALNDAFGDTLASMRKHAKKGDRNLVVVITDGQENSSKRFTKPQLKETVQKLTAKGWEFIFLGVDIDAFADATSYGIGTFTQGARTGVSLKSQYAVLSTSTSNWSGGSSTVGSMPTSIDKDGKTKKEPVTTP